MAITTKVIRALDIVLSYINKDFLYKNLDDYCFLETVSGDTDIKDLGEIGKLVATDGSIASIIRIDGIRKVVNNNETIDTVDILNKKLKSSFKEKGHSLQFFYTKDKDATNEELSKLMSPYKKEASRMGADAGFLFEEKAKFLANDCCYEDNLLIIWSRPSLIQASIKNESEDLANKLKEYPIFEKGQNILLNYQALEDKHDAFLNLIITSFKSAGISISPLCSKKQTNKIKNSISSNLTHENWSARTVLDGNPTIREHDDITIKENDISYYLYPNLRKQLLPDDFYLEKDNTIKVGDNYIASMYVDIPQDDPSTFMDFLNGIDNETPFQMSFKIDGGGLSNVGLKSFMSAILAWSPNSNNKEIKDALEYYRAVDLEGSTVTKNNISINTWATDLKTLNTRKSYLFKALQGWGSITPYFANADLFESFFNSIPAFTPKMSGNNFIETLEDVLYTLPLTRQANIWKEGCIINKTEDGKIMPYQVASELQASFNELIFAKPGSGKSVWSNYSNWSFITTPKSDKLAKGKLPFVGILDIGPSSKGLIKLLKMIFPASKQNEFLYKKLSNTVEDAINFFDTQHGCRLPNSKEKEFIVNFLTLLLTPAGKQTPAGIDSMVNSIVTEAYKFYADNKNPRRYEEFEIPLIDKALSKLKIDAKNRSWWWVTDELFKKSEIRLSKLAQTKAMPILEDLSKIANSNESISTTYSKPMVKDTGETLLEYFNRTLTEVIRDFPILNNSTLLDMSSSRVISLDLNDVAPEGSDTAEKQSNVFYMLGRFSVTRNFFLADDTHKYAPSIYKKYLLNKITEHRVTPKRFCVDELHRTSNLPSFRNQIKRDMREGRKWKLSVCVISQLLKDFDDDMIDLCNSKFILSGGDNYKEIVSKFDLSGEVSNIVRNELNGPTFKGVPFVAKFTTKTGEYTQFLYNALSPIEMWCFTSTTEDVRMLELMESNFSSKDSFKILAQSFPNGTITKQLSKMQNDPRYADIESPIDYIIKKIKQQHKDLVVI